MLLRQERIELFSTSKEAESAPLLTIQMLRSERDEEMEKNKGLLRRLTTIHDKQKGELRKLNMEHYQEKQKVHLEHERVTQELESRIMEMNIRSEQLHRELKEAKSGEMVWAQKLELEMASVKEEHR